MTRKPEEINKPDSKVNSDKGNGFKPEKKTQNLLNTENKTPNILWWITVLLVTSNLERKAQIIKTM